MAGKLANTAPTCPQTVFARTGIGRNQPKNRLMALVLAHVQETAMKRFMERPQKQRQKQIIPLLTQRARSCL